LAKSFFSKNEAISQQTSKDRDDPNPPIRTSSLFQARWLKGQLLFVGGGHRMF